VGATATADEAAVFNLVFLFSLGDDVVVLDSHSRMVLLAGGDTRLVYARAATVLPDTLHAEAMCGRTSPKKQRQ
jgi:hypothetical protein